MAGMFYSLREALKKLNMTEEQARELVKEGKLREFRDGSNVLFKIDEVKALMSDTGVTGSEETPAASQEGTGKDEISLVPEASVPEASVPEASVPEASVPEASVPETVVPEASVPETVVPEAVVPETIEDTATEEELTDADTVIGEQGVNVLGETDSEVDDTIGETKGTTAEVSLEEIEEDVNLDTFGSGSGLLDLSLQADDTSLGGILDEIYTSEGEQEQKTREGSGLEVPVEAGQMLPEEELAGPEPTLEAPAVVRGYIEPEPDTVSNAFGIMLFLPLLVTVYTAIVVVAGFNGVMPVVRGKIQDMIWYIMIGLAVAGGVIIGAAFMLTGKGGKAGKKQKAKKPKRAKRKPEPTPES